MTAKILYWNVEKFNDQKVANTAPGGDDFMMDAGEPEQGAERLAYMLDTFASGLDPGNNAFIPDFIVIVEVGKGFQLNAQGNLVNSNPATAVITLLNAIRNNNVLNNGRDWRMVPPIVLGTAGRGEGVAVYYNATAWYFLGPEQRQATYGAAYWGALQHRRIPYDYGLAEYRGLYEDFQQGQFFYRGVVNEGGRLRGPLKFPTSDNRPPWLTYFGSVAGAPPTLLRLMSFHSSPDTAIEATKTIARIPEMMGAFTAARQIDVILGDFNVDNLANGSWQVGGAFHSFLTTANPVYTPLVRAPNLLNPAYNGYYMTEAAQLNQSTIEKDDQPNGLYPGYGYLHLSIDNAFFRTNLAAVNSRGTIINRAVPTPYTAPVPPAVPPPALGGLTYQDSFEESIANILGHLAMDEDYDANTTFREWANFGKVRSTSDHLPLIFEV